MFFMTQVFGNNFDCIKIIQCIVFEHREMTLPRDEISEKQCNLN